jgi:alcohol/geraniol dehydrogenase (NADP+)
MSDKIRAFAQLGPGGPLEEIEIAAPGELLEHEVEIAVEMCSVCHSDVHLIDGDWGKQQRPLIVGHEIVGRIVRVGERVSEITPQGTRAPGTLVGVGWQAGSCMNCYECKTERPHLCQGGKLRTCVGRAGGFAERVVVDARFCFPLPPGINPKTAAPLFCAGLTVFSPLQRLRKPGENVGVVGIGGLGHLAIRFAKAQGGVVTAYDPDPEKEALAKSLGAFRFVNTRDVGSEKFVPQVPLLLVTTHADLDWNAWMKVLELEGTACLIGIPKKPIVLSPDPLLDDQKSITGSVIGSPKTMEAMLKIAARDKIEPIVERMPMTLENVNLALNRVREGKARFRIILDRV